MNDVYARNKQNHTSIKKILSAMQDYRVNVHL